MTQKYLIQRLKSNLQYDDITVFQLTINIYEYIIFFDRMMVQNNSELQYLIVIFNFIVNQVWNINNTNIFYQIYLKIKRMGIMCTIKVSALNYAFILLVFILELSATFVSGFYIMIGMNMFLKYLYKSVFKDNQQAIDKQLETIRTNQYIQQKIEEPQVYEYICQQTIIGYFHFLVYQILLIVVNVMFSDSSSSSFNIYQIIYCFGSSQSQIGQLTIQNIIIFNIFLLMLVVALMSRKQRQSIRLVKQSTKHQIFMAQFIFSLVFICFCNKQLSKTAKIKQPIKI